MASHRRNLLFAAAWLATAAASGLLAAWLLRPPPERVEVLVTGEAPAPRSAGGAAPARDSAPPAGAEARGSTPAASAAGPEIPPSGTPLHPVSLLVRVSLPEGKAAEGGTVYALGPGEPGSDDAEDLCHAEVGDEGTATLRLPGPGLYDIGYAGDRGTVVAPDVRVAPGDAGELALVLPGDRPVSAVCTGWPPSAGALLTVALQAAKSPGAHDLPGRGETGPLSARFFLGPGGEGTSPPLPEGRSMDVALSLQEMLPWYLAPTAEQRRHIALLPSPRFDLEPEARTVRAGETLRFHLRPVACLAATIVWERRAAAVPGQPLSYRLQVDLVQGGMRQRQALHSKVAAESLPPPGGLMFRGTAGPCRIEWFGTAVRAGSREDVVLRDGEVTECPLLLQIDADARSEGPPVGKPARDEEAAPPEDLDVTVEGVPPGRSASVFGIYQPERSNLRETFESGMDAEDEKVTLGGEVRTARAVAAVAPPDLASDPVPAPASGPLRLVLRPAGLVIAAPEEVFPPEFGRLRVRLAGGRPIPVANENGTRFAETAADVAVAAGTLLGPFPEGTYTFEVRLGGVRLPDASVTVRAGKVEVLRIRR